MSDPYSPEVLDEIREQHLHEVQTEAGVEPNISAPTDRAEPTTTTGDVIYAWQMQVEHGWNIVGMVLQNGTTLPLVTTSMALAWEAFEVAQMHANRHQCQVRLATFTFSGLAAVVEPND